MSRLGIWRIGILAAGLTLLVASWAADASAKSCLIPLFCDAFGSSGHAAAPQVAPSGRMRHPLQLATAARSNAGHRHAGRAHTHHRTARHQPPREDALRFTREDTPRVLAEENENVVAQHPLRHAPRFAAEPHDRPGATDARKAETVAAIVPLLDWADHDDRVAAVMAASQAMRFDLVAEWRRAVGEIAMMDTVPEETLKSFNAFPP